MKNAEAESAEFSDMRILIVDDDDFQIDLMREMLLCLGVSSVPLQSARSGADALRRLGRGPFPDLLICDLHMPGMDGFQFMESLANAGFANSILIVSGQSGQVRYSAGLVAQLRRLHYLGALGKPATPADLTAMLREVLKYRQYQPLS